MRNTFLTVYMLVILVVSASFGCSGSDTAIAPVQDTPGDISPDMQRQPETDRVLWGMWEISFDPDEMTADVVQLRTALPHYNITEYILPPACDDCFGIAVNSFNPTDHDPDVEFVPHALAARRPESAAQPRIRSQPFKAICHQIRSPRGNQEPFPAVPNHVGNTAHCGTHRRLLQGHRFQQGDRQTLEARRHRKHVKRLHHPEQ